MSDNLQIRVGEMPTIQLAEREDLLIFDGNVRTSLAHLDENLVATRVLTGQDEAP